MIAFAHGLDVVHERMMCLWLFLSQASGRMILWFINMGKTQEIKYEEGEQIFVYGHMKFEIHFGQLRG